MSRARALRRRWVNFTVFVLCLLCVGLILFPLASILYTVIAKGASVLSFHFLVAPAPPPCSPQPGVTCQIGGIGPALQGTLILIGLSSGISIPIGVLTGIFVSEYGARGMGRVVSFFTDVMTGVPSIVVGVFVYALFLNYDQYLFGQRIAFSALSGAAALSVIMIPIVARTCEEALRAIPNSVREAALALGVPKYRTTLSVVVLSALPAVLTGALLAVMRAGGEAAPLLLTAFGSPRGFTGLNAPIAAIPTLIFDQGLSTYSNWQAGAWGAAFILILLMLAISVTARMVLRNRFKVVSGG